jgi:pilus assembly protein Flp/PilA
MPGSLWGRLEALRSDRRAVTAIEYCIIAAAILLAVVAALNAVGSGLQTQFSSVSAALH